MWCRAKKREKRSRPIPFFLFAVFFAAILCGAAVAAQDPGAAITEIARELGLQTDLPAAENQIQNKAPVTPHFSKKTEGIILNILKFIIYIIAFIQYGAPIILLILIIVLLILIIVLLFKNRPSLFSRRKKIAVRQAVPSISPHEAVARMETTQSEADALAQTGQFSEAMHALLLRSIIELRQRIDQSIADSLTSREIARLVKLPGGGNAAFYAIVGGVEEVYFGDQPAGESDYRRCRQYFSALVQALKGKVT